MMVFALCESLFGSQIGCDLPGFKEEFCHVLKKNKFDVFYRSRCRHSLIYKEKEKMVCIYGE